MIPAASYVVNENHQATSDPRFDMRLTEKFDNDDTASVGWTWLAAILIAGTLIVSGYLDQESANTGEQTVVASGDKYASNAPTGQTTRMTVPSADVGRDKGY